MINTLSKFGKNFGIHNLGDYQDLYLRTDVVLLANVFEAFRDTCLNHYKLDPAHFYTSPGLAWKACLKHTGIKLDVLTNPDMLLMFKQGIKGGITQVVHKYTSANNKYMGDNRKNGLILIMTPEKQDKTLELSKH